METNQEYWNEIFETKSPNEVSWTQEIPETSLQFIHSCKLPQTAAIIDVGGGDSKLVDFLLAEGFENISVLDISEKALEKAKKRLGEKAGKVAWIVTDITEFKSSQTFDLWHDRAAFHFLTSDVQIAKYLEIAAQYIKSGGFLVIGTFSPDGPTKCSGLEIKQYNEDALTQQFEAYFTKINCRREDHKTPFGTIQNFQFCAFQRK